MTVNPTRSKTTPKKKRELENYIIDSSEKKLKPASSCQSIENHEQLHCTNTSFPKTFSFTCSNDTKNKNDAKIKICSWNIAGWKAAMKKDAMRYLKAENADVVCLQETKLNSDPYPVLSANVNSSSNDSTSSSKSTTTTASATSSLASFLKTDPKNKNSSKKNKENTKEESVGNNTEDAVDNGDDSVGFDLKDYPYQYFNHSTETKGYAGTMIASKIKPLSLQFGMGISKFDNEGRLITLELEHYYIINSYVPNASSELKRLDFKLEYEDALGKYLNKLEEKKPIIWVGDLNVAHHEVDLARPKTNQKTPGFTPQERGKFSELLSNYNWVDVWRHFHPEITGGYTYFSYRFSCRTKRIGWRLDYFVTSESLIDKIGSCLIRDEVYGASDHVPLVMMVEK